MRMRGRRGGERARVTSSGSTSNSNAQAQIFCTTSHPMLTCQRNNPTRIEPQKLKEWEEREATRQAQLEGLGADGDKRKQQRRGGGPDADGGAEEEEGSRFVAYVPLPDQAAIEQRVLEKKVRGLFLLSEPSTAVGRHWERG
jgi:hypothetical protein